MLRPKASGLFFKFLIIVSTAFGIGTATQNAGAAESISCKNVMKSGVQIAWQSIATGVTSTLDLASPWPAPIFNRAAVVMNKQLVDPDYAPSLNELTVLTRYGIDQKKFAKRSAFLKAHPRFRLAKRGLQIARSSLAILALSTATTQAYEMETHTLTFAQYEQALLQPVDDAQSPSVELLTETVPFPHAAIRIGDTVYSYGVTYMTRKTVYDYFDGADKLPVGKVGQSLSRSVRATELRLSRDEAIALERELEKNVGKRYDNQTGVNDCSAMLARALRKTQTLPLPEEIDAFPTALSTYLTVRHVLGDSRVGATSMLIPGGANPYLYLLRNQEVAVAESNLFITSLPVNLPARVYFDLSVKGEKLQAYSESQKVEISNWRKEANVEIAEQLGSYGASGDLHQIPSDRLKMILEFVIVPKINDEQRALRSLSIHFHDIVQSEERLDDLQKVADEIHKELRRRAQGPETN